MKKNQIKKALNISILLVTVFASFLSAPIPSFAQNASAKDYTLLAPLPCIPGNGISCSGTGAQLTETVSFKTYVQYAINVIIALSAVAAVAMIVWGGLQYMTATTISSKNGGLETAKNALYGLLLVLCSYIILRTIDPRLVQIPTTLVPQLTLKNTEDTSMTFFTQLTQDTARNQAITTEAQSAMEQARTAATNKQQQIDALTEQFNTLNNDPNASQDEINKIETEIQKAVNELNAIKAEASYNAYKASLYGQIGYLKSIESTADRSAIVNSLARIDDAYTKGLNSLTSLGDPDNRAPTLTEDYNYVHAQLLMLKFQKAERGTPDLYYSNVLATKNAILGDIAAVNDPTKKAELTALYNKIEPEIKANLK